MSAKYDGPDANDREGGTAAIGDGHHALGDAGDNIERVAMAAADAERVEQMVVNELRRRSFQSADLPDASGLRSPSPSAPSSAGGRSIVRRASKGVDALVAASSLGHLKPEPIHVPDSRRAVHDPSGDRRKGSAATSYRRSSSASSAGGSKKGGQNPDDGKPSRPLTAYHIFLQIEREYM